MAGSGLRPILRLFHSAQAEAKAELKAGFLSHSPEWCRCNFRGFDVRQRSKTELEHQLGTRQAHDSASSLVPVAGKQVKR